MMNRFIINLLEGGEVHEMDVPPRHPLFGLRLDTQVLSMTLNRSVEFKWFGLKGR
jgi:hypothetical protein